MDNEQVTRFTKHWTKAQPSVFAFISATITSFSDAEDVLQKVAASAVSKFREYDDAKPFVGWVIGFARIEILRYLRERATDRHEFIAESLGQIADGFLTIAPELDDRRRALSGCLQKLEGRAREVLQKRYSDGLKTAKIAALSANF